MSNESLSDVFRLLSQRRRNGVLSISSSGRVLNLSFKEGRIVGVEELGQRASVAICARLALAGGLKDKVVDLVANAKVNPDQLFSLLVGRGYVSEEDFIRAKRACELDLLHSLRNLEAEEVEFAPRVLRHEPRFSLSVWPGQALLDFAELENDEGRFIGLFDGLEADSKLVCSQGEIHAKLNEAERVVLELAMEASSPKKIYDTSLLSRFDTTEALLSLHDQNLIWVKTLEAPIESAMTDQSERSESSQVSLLDVSEEETSTTSISSVESSRSQQNEPVQSEKDEGVSHLVDDAVHLLSKMNSEDSAEFDSQVEEVFEEHVRSSDAGKREERKSEDERNLGAESDTGRQGASEEEGPWSTENEHSDVDRGEPVAESPATCDERPEFQHILSSLNSYLLDSVVLRKSVLIVCLLFLLVFALVGPGLLERWFDALAHFPFNS